MKTLVVFYSKTGNTKKVAEAVAAKLNCDIDELRFDEKTKETTSSANPAEYDRLILLSPIWAFSVAEPLKNFVVKYKPAIKNYDLIVTCDLFGLRGCVSFCKSKLGASPGAALRIKSKDVKSGIFDISAIK